MFLIHLTGPSFELRREWFDTAHPALAPHTNDLPPRRGHRGSIIPPLRIGSASMHEVVLPGLARLHLLLEQPQPGEVRVRAVVPESRLFVDEVPVVDTAPLRPGSVLRFASYALRLTRTAPLTAAQQVRFAALTRDDVAWRVFADELAEAGNTALAEWMHLERAVTGATRAQLTGPSRSELERAGREVPLSSRAAVASARLLGCTSRQCPGSWPALGLTPEARFRDCAACGRAVAYCADDAEGSRLALRGIPVALDAGAEGPRQGQPWPLVPVG